MNPLDLIGDPLTNIYFSVIIDNMGIGRWSKVSGLGIDFTGGAGANKTQKGVAIGGGGTQVYNQMGAISYPPVVLTRPVGPATADILHWLRSYAKQVVKTTAVIIAIDPICPWVYQWTLEGVVPLTWKMNDFDVSGQPKIMEEVLTLAHEGFLDLEIDIPIPGLGGSVSLP